MQATNSPRVPADLRRLHVLCDVVLGAGDSSDETALGDLFGHGLPVARRSVAAAITPLAVADLEDMGVCVLRGGRVHPTVSITECDGLIFAGDLGGDQPDQVGGVTRAGITLSQLTVRKETAATLDLGTGCGLQALLSAEHSAHVTAIDVNPRALRFAAFNAALNGIENVELAQGSWLAPVRGRKFDLVVTNPPYVISPDSTFVYRDSGLPGDAISRRLVHDIPAILNEHGTGTILCNWVHGSDQPWSAPLEEWVRDIGCDALLLHYASDDPRDYARRWNQTTADRDPGVYDECEYYQERGIEAIASGAVVLRRRDGHNWVHTLTGAEAPTGPAGEQIQRLFAGHDHPVGEEGLLRESFALVEGHSVEQTLSYRGGEYANHPAIVRTRPGLGANAEIDPRAVHLLLACDGTSTLGQIIERVAERVSMPRETLTPLAVSTFRTLLDRGLLEFTAGDTHVARVGSGLPEPAGART
ncbi:MAG: methyltransferase [Solirubrobacterales bacterium]|nr:methyltransferase [Solirubrobacterales bacterium]